LLMDEPLSNLDARLREEVRTRIRDLAKELGSTVLYVTHDQVEAMAVADKIALLQHGDLLQAGTPAEMYASPSCPDVANFFGEMNWLEGTVVRPGVAETAIGPLRFSASPPEGSVMLGFRPEALAPANGAAAENAVSGKLASSTFLGDQFLFRARVGELLLLGKSRMQPAGVDDTIQLAIRP